MRTLGVFDSDEPPFLGLAESKIWAPDALLPGKAVYVFVWPDRPWTVNQQARTTTKHGAFRFHDLEKQWKARFVELSQGCPPLRWCNVDVTHEIPNRSGEPDSGACYMAVKAAVDGIVAARVLPNDKPATVRRISMWPPTVTDRDAIVIALSGPLAKAP